MDQNSRQRIQRQRPDLPTCRLRCQGARGVTGGFPVRIKKIGFCVRSLNDHADPVDLMAMEAGLLAEAIERGNDISLAIRLAAV